MKRLTVITFTPTPKLLAYLEELAEMDHGYGETAEKVALGLVWRGIENLRWRGVLRDLTPKV